MDLGWPRHLIQIEGMTASDISRILDTAEQYVARNRAGDKKHPILKGRTLINLFFENSTRTRTSFELAGKRLGMDVVNISAAASSLVKGESLLDTARTLDAMQADVLVVRSPHAGAAQLIARHVRAHVINAGDGAHEHPTQALLDALVIRRFTSSRLHAGISRNALQSKFQEIPRQARDDSFQNLRVAICGDIAHSRVARSNIHLLKTLGANVTLIAPPNLMPTGAAGFGVAFTHDMRQGIADADVVMMLRIQHERMAGRGIASTQEYFEYYGLDRTKLRLAKPDALVLHPGPMNRGVEIASDVADDLTHSGILTQVEMGVAVRQTVLELVVGTP